MRVRRERVDLALPGAARSVATIFRSGRWWIGWVDSVPGVNAQERSRVALLASMRATLHEAFQLQAEID